MLVRRIGILKLIKAEDLYDFDDSTDIYVAVRVNASWAEMSTLSRYYRVWVPIMGVLDDRRSPINSVSYPVQPGRDACR